MTRSERDNSVPDHGSYLSAMYAQRFSLQELKSKEDLWTVLVEVVFQQYVPVRGTVVDLAAGYCEFINHIRAERRIAVDLNPDTASWANQGVEVVCNRSDELTDIATSIADTVFSSNFFEHLPSKSALLDTLDECRRILKPSGQIVILMPNIRNLPGAYWDYLDHHLPLTHVSLTEALTLSGFIINRVEPKFLPYTVRDSRIPVKPWLIRGYLKFKPAWYVLGKQMLVIATKPENSESPAMR
jgi:SAM-dependent methyltransferase